LYHQHAAQRQRVVLLVLVQHQRLVLRMLVLRILLPLHALQMQQHTLAFAYKAISVLCANGQNQAARTVGVALSTGARVLSSVMVECFACC
jgi:hypothetical protein